MRLLPSCFMGMVALVLIVGEQSISDVCLGADMSLVNESADQGHLAKISIESTAMNRGDGLAAVEKLTDQALLSKVALDAQDLYIRKAAAEKLTEETVLIKVAMEDTNSYVRIVAVEKLTDQSILAKVAMTDEDVYVRQAAVSKMTDQAVLSRLAATDKNVNVRQTAMERLSNKKVLAKIAMDDKDTKIRMSLINKLEDQELFAKLATNDQIVAVRRAAVEKLTDQSVLAKIALNDKDLEMRKAAIERLTNQSVLAKLAMSDKDAAIRKAAVVKLTDQSALAKIALNDKDLEMRKAAIERLTNQTVLMEIAGKNPAAAIRLAAITNSNLNNDSFILRRSVEDISAEVRLAAVNSLRTQQALARAAQTSYEAGLRQAANRLLEDSALREETTLMQQQIEAELATVSELPLNDKKLADIALSAKFDFIGEAAASRLEDSALLAKVAVSSHRRNILKIVFAKLEDKPALQRVAKEAVDPSIRLAAQIKMGRTWQAAFENASARGSSKQALGEVLSAITYFPTQDGVQEGVVEACLNFIRRGDESRIPELGELLHNYGNVQLAEDYLNCGQPDLDREARIWANHHGYNIGTGGGSHRASWGTGRY